METQTVIERWQQGDESAAEEIYNEHRTRVYRLAYGLLGNAHDAEDTAQDALGYALQHINRYDPTRAKFSTWLHMITVSRARDRLRKRRVTFISLAQLLGAGKELKADSADPETESERQHIRRDVLEAVQKLPPKLKEAIILRYWAGHTFQEIALISGCPLGTAQSRVRLAFKRLRNDLEPAEIAAIVEAQ